MVSESVKNVAFIILAISVFVIIFLLVLDIFYKKLIAQTACVWVAEQVELEITKALGIRPLEWLCKALIKF